MSSDLLVVDVGTSGVRAAVVDADGARRRTCTTARCCRRRRRRASSSSTPPRWRPRCSTSPARRWTRRRPGRRGRHRQPAGVDDRVGPRHRRARRPRHRLAGPAHRRHVPRCCRPRASALAPERVGHQARLSCSTWPTPTATRDLCFGTVDTWMAWTLSGGDAARHRRHQRRRHRPACTATRSDWDDARARGAATSRRRCCRRSSTRPAWSARRRRCPGAPPIAGIAGDQQASLIGQGCTRPGLAKITFGTGGMLDVCVGAERPVVRRAGRRRAASRSSPGAAAARSRGASRR